MCARNFERCIIDKFLEIYGKHHNGQWALDELKWLVFEEHCKAFYSLTAEEQWYVRRVIDALEKVHG